MSTRSQDARRERLEAWWPIVARIVAFILGVAILVQQSFLTPNPPGAQDSLLATAIGLMGPLAAYVIAGGIEKARQG